MTISLKWTDKRCNSGEQHPTCILQINLNFLYITFVQNFIHNHLFLLLKIFISMEIANDSFWNSLGLHHGEALNVCQSACLYSSFQVFFDYLNFQFNRLLYYINNRPSWNWIYRFILKTKLELGIWCEAPLWYIVEVQMYPIAKSWQMYSLWYRSGHAISIILATFRLLGCGWKKISLR